MAACENTEVKSVEFQQVESNIKAFLNDEIPKIGLLDNK